MASLDLNTLAKKKSLTEEDERILDQLLAEQKALIPLVKERMPKEPEWTVQVIHDPNCDVYKKRVGSI